MSMDYAIEHPRFQNTRLVLRSSMLGTVTLLVDDAPSTGKRNVHTIVADDGGEAEVKLIPTMTGVPKIAIDGAEPFDIAPPLPWYAYACALFPFLLVILGGAFGAVFGLFAGYITLGLFRSNSPTWLKFAGSFGITMFSGTMYVFLAVLMQLVLSGL